MPAPKSTAAAKKAKKPAAAKKTAPAKAKVEVQGLEERIAVLESRLDALEEHDIARRAEDAYTSVLEQIKESYAANPTMAIAVGLGLLLIILLIVG